MKIKLNLLKQLCKMTQPQLLNSLSAFLKRYGKDYKNIITTDSYIIAEGQLPVCVVAHLDTVKQDPPQEIYFDKEQGVMWSPQLLGADDRAGVYAILHLLKDGYRPSIIFTTDEELGAVGATTLVSQIPNCPLENLKAIIQLDRRGSKDCVFYDCDNPDFTKYIESFGFKEAPGTFTDISIIAPAWGVAAVNLSVGYYDEHMEIERLKIQELSKTIEKVEKILDNAETMLSYSYIESKRAFNWMKMRYSDNHCELCYKRIPHGSGLQMNGENGWPCWVCDECYVAYWAPGPADG